MRGTSGISALRIGLLPRVIISVPAALRKAALAAVVFMSASTAASAQEEIVIVEEQEPVVTTLLSSRSQSEKTEGTETEIPAAQKPSKFTWGADLGSSFDLTNQGLTSFDLSACFGYRNRALRFLGVGAGIHMMISNSSRAFPVYVQCRTTFTSTQNFVFMEAKAGVSFITLYNSDTRRPLYGSLGLGFTLASGRNFSSHIILGYSFTPLRDVTAPGQTKPMRDLHEAVIRLGVAF